ncbi:MAG: carbamoyltransferase HypF [Planctomycetes bacterium]|jgi:hydrogenase maturation protein HypF|nr:carbamoyltransferase HypF [Planctomycetota bacterium]
MERRRYVVAGTVQGVGFRPFVYRIAVARGLAGWVRNEPGGVQIEVEGPPDALDGFARDLEESAPPHARIASVGESRLEPAGLRGFAIEESGLGEAAAALIPPDIATCPDCLAEMDDPADRRRGYPFINCTNCGPRYTIVRAVPYDRPWTTMAAFPMCADCRREYEDPADRRFHAEPVACPACGPRAFLADASGAPEASADPVAEAAARLARGAIAAVKGLGGFHLACDASDGAAVAELRRRKGREEKPFAVMASDLAAALRFAEASEAERRLLQSPERPIVLLRKKAGGPLAEGVAPRSRSWGVMLPYAPLHHLLLRGAFPALVMTSGNRTDEPIAFRNGEALQRLRGVADFFLLHDRDIETRADDSIARVAAGRETVLRRSRGYVPRPVVLRASGPPVLALGGDLKNAVCLTRGDEAVLSHHVGDLEHAEAHEAFRAAVEHLRRLLGVEPAAVAHDLHPRYFSARRAASFPGLPRIPVQHHHAHAAAVMAENGIAGPVIGVSLDGTGYGTDGTVWGGEFLAADLSGFRRAAHLEAVPMPGADAAAREGWRMAVSHLRRAFPAAGAGEIARFLPAAGPDRVETALRMIERNVNCALTSSAGRLFDAAAAIAGVALASTFEGQAAMEFEGAAAGGEGEAYPFAFREEDGVDAIDTAPLVRALALDAREGAGAGVLSRNFHRTLAEIVVRACERIRGREGTGRVALSGGCFQNEILLSACVAGLQGAGFRVFTHSQVPPNDGGIALGQAAVALAQLAR